MSKKKFLLGLATLAFSPSAFAKNPPVQLDCVSYSQAYDFKIILDGNNSTLEVLRTSGQSKFDLISRQSISLDSAEESDENWDVYEGRSDRKQEIVIRALKSELNHRGKLEAAMTVTSVDRESANWNYQLECIRR